LCKRDAVAMAAKRAITRGVCESHAQGTSRCTIAGQEDRKFRYVSTPTPIILGLGPISLSPTQLLASAQSVSLTFVKRGIIALLALVLVLQASLGCGMAQAETAIKAPCCGLNCPIPSAAADRACCQVRSSGAPVKALSAKPGLPSFQPLVVLIHQSVMMAAPAWFEQASISHPPPGATQLALLCSRQI
jgi:hypothetical protein